jgi:alkylation response protein AidB-like acyl-CoA dehydrogenase
MGLVLNEEQRILRDGARELLDTRAPVAALRKLRDEAHVDGFSRELWSQLVELGWSGMALPEAFGGSDFGFFGVGIALEEAGRTLTVTPMLSSVVMSASIIEALGTEAQKSQYLRGVVHGELLLALALDERPHHRPSTIELQATATPTGFQLNGQKTFVLDGHVADHLLVVARTAGAIDDPHGLSVFLLPCATEGLAITRTTMVDSRNAANISFTRVDLSADQLLGPINGAADALEHALDLGRIALAAEMLGSAQEAFDRTLAYLKLREQFGVAIGSFQALKHRAAQMFSELELARSATYAALSAVDDANDNIGLLASLAKAQCGDTFVLVASEAVQMHGGIGMTDDEEIGFFLKRSRVANQTLGDAAFHRDRYARLAGF